MTAKQVTPDKEKSKKKAPPTKKDVKKTSQATASTQQPQAARKQQRSLKQRLNAYGLSVRLGVLLAAEAVAVVVFGSTRTVPLTVQYLAKDTLASGVAGRDVFAAATRHMADVRVAWLVALFLVVLAVVLVLAGTVLKRQYRVQVERGAHTLRWLGYGVSGGIVVVTLAMLGGVSDSMELILLFGSVLLAGVLVVAAEAVGAGRKLRRVLAVAASVSAALPWLLFAGTVVGVSAFNGNLPTYLYYIYAAGFLLFGAVGLATYLSMKQRGKWADAQYADRMFMLLGVVTVTIVALQIFAGALQA